MRLRRITHNFIFFWHLESEVKTLVALRQRVEKCATPSFALVVVLNPFILSKGETVMVSGKFGSLACGHLTDKNVEKAIIFMDGLAMRIVAQPDDQSVVARAIGARDGAKLPEVVERTIYRHTYVVLATSDEDPDLQKYLDQGNIVLWQDQAQETA